RKELRVSNRSLPEQPNIEQYRKQAKDLLRAHAEGSGAALERIARHHPQLEGKPPDAVRSARFRLADAQFVIAREHGFESWPKFAGHIETLRLSRHVASLDDAESRFIEAACSPRHDHGAGTIEEAEMILARYPHVAASSIYAAAILADEATVRGFLARDPHSATAKGGPL